VQGLGDSDADHAFRASVIVNQGREWPRSLRLVAENDFDLAPSRVLSAEMKEAGQASQIKIYPPYGSSKQEGHTLGYFGASIWAEDVFRFLAGELHDA
jgi:hypothetical protein